MIAVLIKGNPKFIHNDIARSYYNEIEDFLKSLGFKVEVNAGADYTRPRQDAALYIGHSRGAGRYEFMDSKNKKKFLRFGDPDGVIDPVDRKWQAENSPPTNAHPPKEHFTFSEAEKKAITDKVEELGLTISNESRQDLTKLTPELDRLFKMASQEHFLGMFIYTKKLSDVVSLLYRGTVVGFAIPRKDYDGYWRTGPIFVEPKYRGKHIASQFIKSFFSDKPGRSMVDSKNSASRHAFLSAGFVKTGVLRKDGDGMLEEYKKEAYSTESKMSEYEMDTKERLLAMAMNDTYLGPDGLKVGVEGMELIVLPNGEAAGFIMPMNGTGSYKRVGSIYIDPKYRGKNIARDYVTQYFKDKAGQAWIRHDNKPSQGTFKAAGFYRTGRRVTVKGHPYDEWINRPQTLAW